MVYNICMVSDFFYPNTGGVESHIFQLSQCLIERGHKVIVVTHSYNDRVGVRYMTNGLKVYYLPVKVFYNQCVLPTLYCSIVILRQIFIREKIEVVHGHSAFSTLAHEAMFHAANMNLKNVFTDHSLFGFADMSAIVTNNFLQVSLADVNHCICVSFTGKENTVLRACVPAQNVSVIPNAVDSKMFSPSSSSNSTSEINIVIISRLVYRKGIDLLAGVIPVICLDHPEVNFIIGGDGPKRIVLEEVRERMGLQERIKLVGSLEHNEVRDILVEGHIFLNTSLTEAFCMAIVEAASCGLSIVSTKVGGIPEVLPEDMIIFAEPNVADIITALKSAIAKLKKNEVLPKEEMHSRILNMYTWKDVAKRTELVYDKIHKDKARSFISRTQRYLNMGNWSGKALILLLFVAHLFLVLLEVLQPRSCIDICPSTEQLRQYQKDRLRRDPRAESQSLG